MNIIAFFTFNNRFIRDTGCKVCTCTHWHESVKLLFCNNSENFTVIFASLHKLTTAHLD